MADYKTQFNDYCLKIAMNGKEYHPVATNHFTVTMNLPETLVNMADPKKGVFNKEDLQLSLKIANDNFTSPSFSQTPLTYRKGNLGISFPGTIDVFSSTAQFHVFVSKSAYDILYSWKMASGNHLTGEVGDPDDYWADIFIDITTGNKGTLVGTWKLSNCWCSNLQSITLDNNSGNLMSCGITIQYFKPEWIGGQYQETSAE